MANDQAALIPEVFVSRGLPLLRNMLVCAPLVHRDFEQALASRGDTVQYDIPVDYTTNTRPLSETTDLTISPTNREKGTIVLDKHRYVSIILTDQEVAMSADDLAARHMEPMMQALADIMEKDITNLFPLFTANAGTFNTALTEDAILAARKTLLDNKTPNMPLSGVISTKAESELLKIARLTEEDKATGFGEAIRNASLGRRYNADWFVTQTVPATGNNTSNALFYRNAIALVQRRMGSPNAPGVTASEIEQDGYTLRTTLGYNVQKGGVQLTVDTLYAVKILRQENGVELRN